MKIRTWGPPFLAIVVAAVLLPLMASQGEQARLTLAVTATPTANAMAVDAMPGGVTDFTRTITGIAPFEVDIVIANATLPYQAYQYRLRWDPEVLSFDAAEDLQPAGLSACSKPMLAASSVWGSCGRGSGAARFAGMVSRITLHCIADGSSPLHLVTPAEGPFHTATFDAVFGNLDTVLTDASVTCRDVGALAPEPIPPDNDSFLGAKAVASLPFHDGISTDGATQELFEPSSCKMGDATVWYRFTPEATQFVHASTLGSDFDTVLGVYTGASVGSLASVACNDDSDGLQSQLTTELEAGKTYYFQVGGFFAHRGSLVFDLEAVPPPMPNAIAVDAVSGGGVESTRTVTGTARFDVDIHVTGASHPYQGYQYMLQWDPAVLAYDGQTNLSPASLSLCATATVTESTVYAGCARVSGETQFVGPVNTITLHCVADGTSPLRLLTAAESPHFPTETLGPAGSKIDHIRTDASITCRGTGRRAAPSPTSTPGPVLPVTGTGGLLEDR